MKTADLEKQTPKQILKHFYEMNNLPLDGEQSSPYVKIELTSTLHFYFPNFNARRKAVINTIFIT